MHVYTYLYIFTHETFFNEISLIFIKLITSWTLQIYNIEAEEVNEILIQIKLKKQRCSFIITVIILEKNLRIVIQTRFIISYRELLVVFHKYNTNIDSFQAIIILFLSQDWLKSRPRTFFEGERTWIKVNKIWDCDLYFGSHVKSAAISDIPINKQEFTQEFAWVPRSDEEHNDVSGRRTYPMNYKQYAGAAGLKRWSSWKNHGFVNHREVGANQVNAVALVSFDVSSWIFALICASHFYLTIRQKVISL